MMDFMAVSSYGAGKRESAGFARVTLDLQTDIRDRNVLLVEDIVDSGHTISSVLQMLETRQPKSLKVCALLDKPERREAHVPIHYLGFTIPNKFVLGMGSTSTNIIATCRSSALWIWISTNRPSDRYRGDDERDKKNSPYAGRWIARVRGRVIAQGGTPEEALRASQSSRHKEKPEIVFMPIPFSLPASIGQNQGYSPPEQEIYLVGGAVRDLLSSRLSPDFDFALPSNGISLARRVANALQADFMVLDDERDTGRVVVTNEDGSRTFLDFATYRGANLEEDLRDRDFTINAIAYNLRDGTTIDPLNGATDIRAKVIRACSPTPLTHDPVRILRGVRQAAAFGYVIEGETRGWMKQAAGEVGRVSIERLRDEIFKILNGPKSAASIRALEMLGVLSSSHA
jgi:hypothetical protein